MRRFGNWLVTRVVFLDGEAWRIRCSGVRHASQGWGASDTGESSLASATRARPEDSGRQEAHRRDPLTESLRRAVPNGTQLAGGRALIPKNAFGWAILAGLFFARVGLLTFFLLAG